MTGKNLISEPRLETYRRFTRSEPKAIELHNMTLQVGSSLMAVIALIELGLRNLANQQISLAYDDVDWMVSRETRIEFRDKEKRSIRTAIQHAKKSQYAKLTYKEKQGLDLQVFPSGVPEDIRHEELSRMRWQTFDVNQGQAISQTTIFFWKRLFSSDYEATLWRGSLRKVFPMKHIKRKDVAIHLEAIYSARNRIAHHDPVYGERLDQAFEAVKFFRKFMNRSKLDNTTDFQEFTEIQFHRLYIDYIAFKRVWKLLED
ncbi:MAG: hypothetical protein L3J33_11130 [Rhodobacteraceae bacterium]|nr:hypothetical protein [Paracoccaceae bacterium]